jgi:acyl-CoA thioesterase
MADVSSSPPSMPQQPAQATPQQVAEAVRDAMWRDDHASKALGMQVLAIGPGTATLTMRVRQDMLNGHQICHGGLMTTLADSTFAFACNAYNELTVASGFDVNLIASAREGDVLTASATEVAKTRRTGVYDIDVRDQTGRRIAVFRGRSTTLTGKLVVPHLPSTRGA